MTKLLVNANVAHAQSCLNGLRMLLDHQHVFENLTDQLAVNASLGKAQLESVVCRSVDVYQDALHKLVMQVVDAVPHTDVRLHHGVPKKDLQCIFGSADPKAELVDYLGKDLGYRLGRLRALAGRLLFPLDAGAEIIVLTRNCIVHQASRVNESLREALNVNPGCDCAPPLAGDMIEMNVGTATLYVDKLKDVLEASGEHLNKTFGIPWDELSAARIAPVRFADWYKWEDTIDTQPETSS